ncbi:MAG: hypothetical protein QF524_05795 [Planctomycetota bacterium]|jgi:hypothetical protein|nr:hypothetical protein [Planctomycetota bacterium]
MDALRKEQVESSIESSEWDLGNKILYDMCSQYPSHNNSAEIIAKVWLIGRSYAAAIERRRNNESGEFNGDDFYIEKVAPEIIHSEIDGWLRSLEAIDGISESTLEVILSVHFNVTELFSKISGLEKRSLASKYLHFHYPELFFIYDSRAVTAVSYLSDLTGRVGQSKYNADNEYRKFCEKCLKIRKYVKDNFKIYLTARQLDNLLLEVEAIA